TGPRLAAVLARRGGLGVLPQDMQLDALVEAIRWVKEQPVRWDTPIVLSPSATAAEALRRVPVADGVSVVVAHTENGEAPRAEDVLGTLSAHRLASVPADAQLGDLVHDEIASISGADLGEHREAFDEVSRLIAQ